MARSFHMVGRTSRRRLFRLRHWSNPAEKTWTGCPLPFLTMSLSLSNHSRKLCSLVRWSPIFLKMSTSSHISEVTLQEFTQTSLYKHSKTWFRFFSKTMAASVASTLSLSPWDGIWISWKVTQHPCIFWRSRKHCNFTFSCSQVSPALQAWGWTIIEA